MKKIFLGIALLLLGCAIAACTDSENDGHGGNFPDASFMLEGDLKDTLNLIGAGTREIYLYYGKGVAESYQTGVLWESSNGNVIIVKPYGRITRNDSCFSIASVTPRERATGEATIKVTLSRDGKQRTLQLPVTTFGVNTIDLSKLPEGSFTDTVGSVAFAMAFIKADTTFDVGERLGIDYDTSWWDKEEYREKWSSRAKRDSYILAWRHRVYDVLQWNEDNVYVGDFYVGQTAVTAGLWKEVMGEPYDFLPEVLGRIWDNGHYLSASRPASLGKEFYNFNLPICFSTFSECEEFIRRLNERTGVTYRMLTHAEAQLICDKGLLKKGPLEPMPKESYCPQREWASGICYCLYSIMFGDTVRNADGNIIEIKHKDTLRECRPSYSNNYNFHLAPYRGNASFNAHPYGQPEILEQIHDLHHHRPYLAGVRLAISAADWKKLKEKK